MSRESHEDAPRGATLRRCRALVVTFEGTSAIGCNYFTQESTPLDAVAFALLERLDEWREPEALFEDARAIATRAEIATALVRLMDGGLVVVADTDAAVLDARFEREWEWGPTAGVFHFGVHGTVYVAPELIAAQVEARMAATAEVEVFASGAAAKIELPLPDPTDPILSVMRRRRSRRTFADADLSREALRDCLFAGFGIVGFGESDGPASERLPLTLTPSGGARNPFEAYICARRVAGLAPGVYHYTGIDHALSVVDDAPLPELSSLLGGQTWFADAGALILLVAHFRRTQRKYPHPGGFRVVLLEAGHIAQNVLLAAASHGLAAAPTCAVSDRELERVCKLDPITQAVLHVVAIGARSSTTSDADFARYIPNPKFPGWLGGV